LLHHVVARNLPMEKLMKRQYASTPQVIGFDAFGLERTVYDLDYHALLASQSNHRLKNGAWSGGGGFYVHHRTIHNTLGLLPVNSYLGTMRGGPTAVNLASYVPLVEPEALDWLAKEAYLSPHGATGWKRARPGNPIANLGQTIVEAREVKRLAPWSIFRGSFRGIPRRAYNHLSKLKNYGGAYLAYNFGWKPLIDDLRKAYQLTYDIDDRLAKLRRYNGRNSKRSRKLRDTTSSTEVVSTTNNAFDYLLTPPLSGSRRGRTIRTVTTEIVDKMWFEGQFRYYVPDIGTLQWDRRARRALFGLDITPSLLWEVMPWSWLIDWFSNVGDVISNMSFNAVDHVVANYAYVMHTEEVNVTTRVQTFWDAYSSTPSTVNYSGGHTEAVHTSRDVRKSRLRANPFGFGITNDGLSAYQSSILAALAVQRG